MAFDNYYNNEDKFNNKLNELGINLGNLNSKIDKLDKVSETIEDRKSSLSTFSIEALERDPKYQDIENDMKMFVENHEIVEKALAVEEIITAQLGPKAGMLSMEEFYVLTPTP